MVDNKRFYDQSFIRGINKGVFENRRSERRRGLVCVWVCVCIRHQVVMLMCPISVFPCVAMASVGTGDGRNLRQVISPVDGPLYLRQVGWLGWAGHEVACARAGGHHSQVSVRLCPSPAGVPWLNQAAATGCCCCSWRSHVSLTGSCFWRPRQELDCINPFIGLVVLLFFCYASEELMRWNRPMN